MVQSTTNIKQNAPGSLKACKYFVNHQVHLGGIRLCGVDRLTLLQLSSSGKSHASVVYAGVYLVLSCLTVQVLLRCGFVAAPVRETF